MDFPHKSWVIRNTPFHAMISSWYTVRCRYNPVNFIKKKSPKTSQSSPVRASFRVSFVYSAFDWYLSQFRQWWHAMPCYTGPLYNRTPVYDVVFNCLFWQISDWKEIIDKMQSIPRSILYHFSHRYYGTCHGVVIILRYIFINFLNFQTNKQWLCWHVRIHVIICYCSWY